MMEKEKVLKVEKIEQKILVMSVTTKMQTHMMKNIKNIKNETTKIIINS
jgi:hypothetical protein